MTSEGTTLSVHRCRFVDFTPSAVTALAFPPLPLPSAKGKNVAIRKALKFGTLAVGRANGNIEICEWSGSDQELQAPQAWVVRKTIPGPFPSKVDSLAFTLRNPDLLPADETPKLADLRLFSAGGGSDLAEWDLERSCIRRTIPSQGGSIWCIAPNPASTILAIGCEDGAVRLLSLEHDTLTHLRRLDRVKSRILSVAWGPPVPKQTSDAGGNGGTSDDDDDDDDVEWTDSWIVGGCSDSSLRKWDVATGRVGERMSTDKMRGERTLVWAVGVLGDGTIVSGDSLGTVKFWESKTCTQLHSFQAHGADVLCLTISPEGTAVYTSGVDQKVFQFTHVKTQQSATQSSLLSRSSGRWVQSSSRRMHSHDVRALAMWPSHTPLPPSHRRQFPLDVAPVLASGGLDMSVVVTPAALPASTVTHVVNPLSTSTAATFEDSYHRRLAYTSAPYNASALHLARQARLLLCMRDTGLSLWRIHRRRSIFFDVKNADEEPPADGGWEQVLDMDLNVHTNLVASAISDDGRWVAVSDWYESKLFRIETPENDTVKPKRIRNFTELVQAHLPGSTASTGASCFAFSPDNRKLIMASTSTSYVLVIDLGDTPRVLRRFEHHHLRNVMLGDRVVRGRPKGTGPEDVEMADLENDDDENANEDVQSRDKPERESSDSEPEASNTKPLAVTVTRMAVSPDGQWLATTDDHCRTHVFNLDAVAYHCVLPSFPQPAHALAFDARAPNVLVLGLADNTLQVYDVEARTFPAWSRPLAGALPARFKGLHDPVLGAAFDAGGAPRSALFWGATWMCRVKLDAGVEYGGFEKKRRWGGQRLQARPPPSVVVSGTNNVMLGEEPKTVPQQNFKLVTHYRPLLFVDFIGPGELVVVERPLVDVLAKLPPAFFKPKYGAT